MSPGATPSLSVVAYDEMKYRIIRSIVQPGQWITEKAVAEELKLGLSPVRVALARLSNEGLLVTLPRRGYRVSALTLKMTDDLFDAWKLLAAEIMRLATMNMTPDGLSTYKGLAERARTRHQDPDRDPVDVWLDNAREQWHFFARVADNQYLEDMYLRLDSQLSRLFSLTFSTSLEVGFNDRRQKTMNRLLRDRDADAVVAETVRFVEMVHSEARRTLTSPAASYLVDVAL